jgi:hypothetical protein
VKFLCVTCDQAMKLTGTQGPEEGSLTVLFACPSCGRKVAMLTNAMETQMVRSLGVQIGGRTVAHEPMGMVRRFLTEPAEPAAGAAPDPGRSGSRCPFADTLAMAGAADAPAVTWTREAEERIDRVPEFARAMVRTGVEMHAREHGLTRIDTSVIDAVKTRFGM